MTSSTPTVVTSWHRRKLLKKWTCARGFAYVGVCDQVSNRKLCHSLFETAKERNIFQSIRCISTESASRQCQNYKIWPQSRSYLFSPYSECVRFNGFYVRARSRTYLWLTFITASILHIINPYTLKCLSRNVVVKSSYTLNSFPCHGIFLYDICDVSALLTMLMHLPSCAEVFAACVLIISHFVSLFQWSIMHNANPTCDFIITCVEYVHEVFGFIVETSIKSNIIVQLLNQ